MAFESTNEKAQPERQITEGQKAVSLFDFENGNPKLFEHKKVIAALIDEIDALRASTPNGGAKRYCALTITALEEVDHWAEKAHRLA